MCDIDVCLQTLGPRKQKVTNLSTTPYISCKILGSISNVAKILRPYVWPTEQSLINCLIICSILFGTRFVYLESISTVRLCNFAYISCSIAYRLFRPRVIVDWLMVFLSPNVFIVFVLYGLGIIVFFLLCILSSVSNYSTALV